MKKPKTASPRRDAKRAASGPTPAHGRAVWFEVPSQFGPWRGLVTPRGLARLAPAEQFGAPPVGPDGAVARRDDSHPAAVELREYLAGRRRAFSVPVDLSAEPPFRRAVLEALTARVPHGATTTYGELARIVGKPRAARAAGQAVGGNPVPLVVPCHRVLGANGALGGFAFGLPMKRALLELEGVEGV